MSLSLRFPHHIPINTPYVLHAPPTSHSSRFYHPNNIWQGIQNIKLPVTQFSPNPYLVPLGLPSSLFPSGFPTTTLYTPLLSPIRATWPANLILLDLITRKIFGEKYRSLGSFCSFLHSPVTWYLLGPNILVSTLFSNTLSLRSSLNVSGQVSHPHKTTGKIIDLYILNIYTFG